MAAKAVRFHEDADAEYEDAFDWYLARSPHAAAEFAAELSRAVELIDKLHVVGHLVSVTPADFYLAAFRSPWSTASSRQ
jgi:plasmid stabilization system protein ParE